MWLPIEVRVAASVVTVVAWATVVQQCISGAWHETKGKVAMAGEAELAQVEVLMASYYGIKTSKDQTVTERAQCVQRIAEIDGMATSLDELVDGARSALLTGVQAWIEALEE